MDQSLSIKDAATFKEAITLYEKKEYKKSLAEVDTLIKRRKGKIHGDSYCLKALLLHHVSKPPPENVPISETGKESVELFKQGLDANPDSHVAWHMCGIFHKLRKEHKEALKAYLKSYEIMKDNVNVHLDLAMIAAQERDYKTLVNVRHKNLSLKMNMHISWSSLVVALYLDKQYKVVEKTVKLYEKVLEIEHNTLKNQTSAQKNADAIEESELLMFCNWAIKNQGEPERALSNLEEIKPKARDVLRWTETKAQLLLDLNRKEEAKQVLLELIERNNDCLNYFEKIEGICGDLTEFYGEMCTKYPKSLVPFLRRLELAAEGKINGFEDLLFEFVQRQLSRNLPNTFVLVESLCKYSQTLPFLLSKVDTFECGKLARDLFRANCLSASGKHEEAVKIASSVYNDKSIGGSADGSSERDLDTDVDVALVYAHILKNAGDFKQSYEVYFKASEAIPGDRLLNTRAATAAFRNNDLVNGYKLAYKFPIQGNHAKTDEEALRHLQGVDSVNVLLEMAEAHHRLRDHGICLKRCLQVIKVFKGYVDEQFDFHFYGPRRGTLRAYCEMIDWEDNIYSHPVYQRAVKIAVKELVDHHSQFPDGLSESEVNSGKSSRVKMMETLDLVRDEDPFAIKFLQSKESLNVALEWAKNMKDSGYLLQTEIYTVQKKYVLANQSLKHAKESGLYTASEINGHGVQIRYTLENDSNASPILRGLQMKLLPTIVTDGDIVNDDLTEFIGKYITDIVLWVRAHIQTNALTVDVVDRSAERVPELTDVSVVEALFMELRRTCLDLTVFKSAVSKYWPCVSFIDF